MPGARPLLFVPLVVAVAGVSVLAVVVPRRSRLLRQQAGALARQAAILQAAAFAAEHLALAENWEAGIAGALERFGAAAGVDRVYLYANRIDAERGLVMSIAQEWSAPTSHATIDDPENRDFPYANGFEHWRQALAAGRVVESLVSDVGPIERADIASEAVKSTLAVPVIVSGSWWGFIGFDDAHVERRWDTTEVDALMVAAGTIGAAIARDHAVTEAVDAKERFRVLVEHSPAVVYVDKLDDTASSLYMSPQIEAIVGHPVEEWIADPDLWPRLLHPDDRRAALEATARHNETGEPFAMDYRLIARDGRTVWIHDEAVMVLGPDGTFAYSQGLMQDITATKLTEEHLEYVAYHDMLTGLPNAAMLNEIATMALARANRSGLAAAILFLDVDGFKLANDTLGAEGEVGCSSPSPLACSKCSVRPTRLPDAAAMSS